MKTGLFRKICVIAALLAYCFLFQGARGLFEKDEGRYTAVAMNMMETGDWLHPKVHHEQEHFNKPPMTYWLIAASLKVFGHHEWAARFPSSLAFLLTIICLCLMGRVYLNGDRFGAGIVYATFFFTVTASNMITTDGVLTFFETAAVASFVFAFWGRRKNRTLSLMSMWLFFALAFLTKGPPGLLPLLSIAAFMILAGKQKGDFRLMWPAGCVIFLMVGGWWYVAMILEDPALAGYFLKDEVAKRIFSTAHQRNDTWYSFLYIYVPILVFGTLPWTYYAWRRVLGSVKHMFKGFRASFDRDQGKDVFLLLWLLIPLTVFILARSRLALYVLPLFAPLAVLAARELDDRRFSYRRSTPWIALWCFLMLAVRFSGGLVTLRQDASWYARELKKASPPGVTEILFVDMRPVLGLKFYLNQDIEAMPLDQLAIDTEEEEKDQEKRLWIVKPGQSAVFQDMIKRSGRSLTLSGRFKWDKDYYLYLEKPLP